MGRGRVGEMQRGSFGHLVIWHADRRRKSRQVLSLVSKADQRKREKTPGQELEPGTWKIQQGVLVEMGGGIREWWVGWSCRLVFVDPRDPGRWAKMASPLHHVDAQMRPPPGCQAKTPTERRIRLDVRQTGAHLYETRQVSSDVCSLLINHAEAPRLQGWLACPAVLDPLPLGKTARPGQPSAAARNNSRPSTRPRWNCPQTSRRKMPADGSIVDTHFFGVSTVSPSH